MWMSATRLMGCWDGGRGGSSRHQLWFLKRIRKLRQNKGTESRRQRFGVRTRCSDFNLWPCLHPRPKKKNFLFCLFFEMIGGSLFHCRCVETMHSRGRKLACLLCVSLLSGFVLTTKNNKYNEEKKERKRNLYQKLSNKNAAWCQLDGCVWLFTSC